MKEYKYFVKYFTGTTEYYRVDVNDDWEWTSARDIKWRMPVSGYSKWTNFLGSKSVPKRFKQLTKEQAFLEMV